MIKKAMIMAAGVGSRLEPLSNVLPKPLVPLANVPAMDIIIKNLISFGIKDIIANTYYKADDIQKHYKNTSFNCNFQFIKEKELSGTAGGVKKCQFFFNENEDFIVLSGDGLSDININKVYESHKRSGAIATIVLKEVDYKNVSMYGVVHTDSNGYVNVFQEKPSIENAKSNLVNTGIYVFNYSIFKYIPKNMFYDFAKNVFPNMLECGLKINTYIMDGYWNDVGSLEQYKTSNFDILRHQINSYKPVVNKTQNGLCLFGKNLKMTDPIKFEGNCIVGENCKIGKNSKIINSILWDDVEIEDNVIVENSIILSSLKIGKSISNIIQSENTAGIPV